MDFKIAEKICESFLTARMNKQISIVSILSIVSEIIMSSKNIQYSRDSSSKFCFLRRMLLSS